MSEEIKYPSEERERAKSYIRVSAEVRTYLHDLYNQIQYEFCEQYEDEIKHLQQKVEQLENIRKEAIEYIEKDKLNIDDSQCYVETQTGWKMIPEIYDNLLNILNKGSESDE